MLFDPRIVGTDKNTQIYKYNTVLFPVRTLSSITAAQTLSYLFTSGCRGYSRKKTTRNRHCLRSITAAQTLSYLFTSGCRGYSRKQNHAKHTPRTNLSLKLYPNRSSSVSGRGKVPLECIVTLQIGPRSIPKRQPKSVKTSKLPLDARRSVCLYH